MLPYTLESATQNLWYNHAQSQIQSSKKNCTVVLNTGNQWGWVEPGLEAGEITELWQLYHRGKKVVQDEDRFKLMKNHQAG